MSAQSTFRKSMLLGVAAAASAAGLMVAAAPVKAIPPVPLAPGNCGDFEFPGNVQLNLSSGDRLTFLANGKDSSGPATGATTMIFLEPLSAQSD